MPKKISDITKIFKKIYSSGRIHQLLKNHLLLYVGIQVLLHPKTKKSLEILQLSIDQKIMRRLRRKYKRDITTFKKDYQKFIFKGDTVENVVWILWYQGIDSAPPLVKSCLESVKRHLPKGRRLITLDKDNYLQYVDLPKFVIEKFNQGKISHAHFSDIIRISLLARHGGTWLDATVFMSDTLKHDFLLESNLFLFQELSPNTFGHSRRISNWFMTAKKNNEIILLVQYLLYKYWEKNDTVMDYFIFHCFFELAIENYSDIWDKVIPFSNAHPHILQFMLFKPFDETMWIALNGLVEFHKLTYKYPEEILSGNTDSYLEYILKLYR